MVWRAGRSLPAPRAEFETARGAGNDSLRYPRPNHWKK
jgi:hypothetical protein